MALRHRHAQMARDGASSDYVAQAYNILHLKGHQNFMPGSKVMAVSDWADLACWSGLFIKFEANVMF